MTDSQSHSQQSHWLSTLSAAPAEAVKALANEVLPALHDFGELQVIHNRTGLVMLPYRDTVKGTAFHLGEALVAEGHVRQGDLTGYGVVLGRDLEQALAVTLLDLTAQREVRCEVLRPFIERESQRQQEAETLLLKKVESTRVQMETF